MISTLKSGCCFMKSSAAILAAVTDPSPPLSEYGPEASLSTPILIDRGSANPDDGKHVARSMIPRTYDRLFMFLPCFLFSNIQNECRRFRAGAADHDRLVGPLLLPAEKQVAMIGHAFDHPRLTSATDAFRTGIVRVDP